MMNRYLTVEWPDSGCTVDFLSENVAVQLKIADGKLYINVQAMHGEEASTRDEHHLEVVLPQREE